MANLPNDMRWAISDSGDQVSVWFFSFHRQGAIRRVLEARCPAEELRTQHDRSLRWRRLRRKGYRAIKVRVRIEEVK